ncbi:unnamed protein product, partial [Callosobruchus maculatus]
MFKPSKKYGNVCAAKHCRNKYYNCDKRFFRFPNDPARARIWAISSCREDLLPNVDRLNKSHRMCSEHFDPTMFTNKFCDRLKHYAVPTIFPSPEGNSTDHNYSRPSRVNVVVEEIPPKKICILSDLLLNP